MSGVEWVLCGVVWCGVVWCGVVWCSAVQCSGVLVREEWSGLKNE